MLTYIQVEHVGANDNCLELTDVSCQRGKYNSKHSTLIIMRIWALTATHVRYANMRLRVIIG